MLTVTVASGQPEFVADDDAVRVDFRQIVIVVDTRSYEHTEQKQW